jgi:hypothetical protein
MIRFMTGAMWFCRIAAPAAIIAGLIFLSMGRLPGLAMVLAGITFGINSFTFALSIESERIHQETMRARASLRERISR